MNPSSHRMKTFIQSKLFLICILGLMLLIPMTVAAQETTEEPQSQPVVTEQPTEVEETVAPTEAPVEETVAPTEATDVVPEETVSTPVPEATVEETTTEPTEEILVESTEETDPLAETTEEATDTTVTPEDTVDPEATPVEETPVDITEINEDFESWTGEGWTVTDWSVESVDDSLVLASSVADASAALDSLDWTNYTASVDVKVEAGNTLKITFADYTLVIATDSRNRLSQNDTVIATSPPVEVVTDEPTWHTVHMNKAGATLTITVDDIPQYTVETTDSPIGIFAFMPSAESGVAIDNLMMAEVDEADVVEIISTPTPQPEVNDPVAETTEEPDLLAEETEEPDLLAEATEDPMAETTEEPDLLAEETEEPDLLAEATEEPAVEVEPTIVVTNLITDDFEGDLAAWQTTASIVEIAEGNHALLLSNSGQLTPATAIESSDVIFSGQANILNNGETAGSFTVAFGTYTVNISTTGITISNNGEVVAATEAEIGVSTWFDFTIEANTSGITVTINNEMLAEYVGELILDSNFVVTTNTSTMFDNLTVDSLSDLVDPLATPGPEVLTEETQSKLRGVAQDLMNAYVEGGEEAVAEFIATTTNETDELGRVLVNVYGHDEAIGDTIAQIITDAGGAVSRIHSSTAEAFVDVQVLIALANNENIRVIRNINRAASTGPVGNNGLGGEDFVETWTEGYNLLSAHEWHLAGVTGQDVKVGVVDVGFSDANNATQRNGNLSCLANTTPVYVPPLDPGLGTSTHGTEMVEVICDMAPDADVYMYRADSVESLRDAVTAARNPTNRMDVLVIALDLGVNTSAGGGVAGDIDANVYGEIEAAKNSGMVVIAAAGNNNKRMLVLQISNGNPGATQIEITGASSGDVIKFGWNDFDGGSPIANISANLGGSGTSDSTNDPNDGMSIQINAAGTVTLTIDPSSVSATTYLQAQIVPADASSSVAFDYDSISLNGDGLTANITEDDNVGNLGRPADSDHVISVGAICTRVSDNPSRWEFSSNGPRFNGSGTPIVLSAAVTQEEAKPTLMSYSFVSTSDLFSAPEGPPPDENGLLPCTDGFGGTSAAAAHVAGMTALIMSNDTNASFAAMNEANATNANTFTTIRNYLQARSVDLPLGAGADGYDNDFGSGLAILGAPSYNLDNTTNLTSQANLLPENCDVANTKYVGQASMDNTSLNGDLITPFTSIAEALNATGDPECIIVMPGEYVSPIFVENSYTNPLLVTGYSDVNRLDVGDVIFWMRGFYSSPDGGYKYASYPVSDPANKQDYRRRAGLYFGEDSANVEFSGFTFVPARFYTDSSGSNNTSSLSAVVMDGSSDTTVSKSQFGKLTLNGVTYPAWDNINATPIQILNNASGARVESNIFNENSVNTVGFYPTVAVINSGAVDNPIVVKDNEMFGNRATNDSGLAEWSAILYAEGSHIDIINNAIYDNEGETIIKIATTPPHEGFASDPIDPIDPTHTRRARIVGNVFLNNLTVSDQPLKQPGALINARFAPMMYIINNTIVGNTIPSTNPFGELFSRGNAASATGTTSNGGSNPAGWDFWEIHNNLIYNNTYYQLVGDTQENTTRGCFRIPNDVSNSDLNAFGYGFSDTFNPDDDPTDIFDERGAQNNWIVSNTVGSSSEFGDCQAAIATFKTQDAPPSPAYLNRNIIDADNQPVHTRSSDDRFIDDGDPSNDAQDGDFQGQDTTIVQPYTEDDWQYYALGDTFIDPDNAAINEYSDGIDAGGDDWISETGGGDVGDPYMDSADIEFDIIGTKRPLDVNNWEISWIDNPALFPPQGISGTSDIDFIVDIGAFEFSPLQFQTQEGLDYYDADQQLIITPENIVPPLTDTLKEDLEDWGADFVSFDLSNVVTGGFGDLSFTILEHPNNYGSQCGNQFEDTRGLVVRGNGFNEIFDYCPPPNFYTNDTDGFDNNDYVSFQVRVEDEAGAFAIGEVRFTIDPDEGGTGDDSDFNESPTVIIGDEEINSVTDESDLFEVVTTLGADVNIRLRPYVRFGNFFFSENSNPEFITGDGRKLVDYPFTYSNVVIDSDPSGIIETPIDTSGLPTSPVIGVTLSDSQTGTAIITYDVTDGKGFTSVGNRLTIRSVSIIPAQGLHDDTSFIWNYSDSENAPFYTEADGFDTEEAPLSGDWEAIRNLQAINDTLHTTSTIDDVATFRFIGSGFTVFMRGGSTETGMPFALKIFDNLDSDAEDLELDILSLAAEGDPDDPNDGEWVAVGNINRLQLNLNNPDNANLSEDVDEGLDDNDLLVCTTRAGIDPLDPTQLVHNQESYTITCDGLALRTHSVQIINTGGGTLSVDAFSIINGDLEFGDAGPIPPGFHDVDNGLLRNAFFDTPGEWTEVVDPIYSNGIAMQALVAPTTDLTFDITNASGFSIGTSYLNNSSSFNICVQEVNLGDTGVCTPVQDNIGTTASQIHIPFYGLDPAATYTVTLTEVDSGFIFDDLVVFDELLAPTANLPLGETDASSLDLVFGEPFGDDWQSEDGKQVINENRSPVGPFVTFQMDDNIDTIGIKADNVVPPPACPRRGPCPEPPPSGLSGLMVCVNRGVSADENTSDYANCVIVDATANTSQFISSVDGSIQAGDDFSNSDGVLYIVEDLFANDDWGDNGTNTVEIFSLYPDPYIEFTSVILTSTDSGLGSGIYTYNSPGFSYVQYNRADGTYSNTTIADDGSGAFNSVELTECLASRRGVCQETIIIGNPIETTGVGNAILFKMVGSGLNPNFLPTAHSRARICFAQGIVETDPALIASEIQANGDCQTLDLSKQVPFIHGIENSVQHVMIELLPGIIGEEEVCNNFRRGSCTASELVSIVPTMYFEGIEISSVDWESLSPLTSGNRYETNFSNRRNANNFAYIGQWTTKPDTDGTHSGTSYDQTSGDAGATILFVVEDANAISILRDLQTPQVQCSGREISRGTCEAPNGNFDNVIECPRRGPCPEPDPGFSDITVCVAPLSNANDRLCSVHSSEGLATQVPLLISLNDDFIVGDYLVSVTPNDSKGFIIDAVDVFDSTSDTMTAGTYQETSELIAYTIGQREVIKDTSFETEQALLDDGSGENWDWSVSTGVSSSITSEDSFIGARSVKLDADTNDALVSPLVDFTNGVRYTVVARVNVVTGNVDMRLDGVSNFETQSSLFTNKWELLRFSFEATSNVTDQLEFVATTDSTTFFVDDVHIYEEASWTSANGDLANGQLAVSNGHGSKATFIFNGTGFTVKLDSDDTSGETRICYDDDLGFGSPTCFTYDNEQPAAETVCTGSGRNAVCTEIPSTNNNGHTTVGLPLGDYKVTIEQMDNGMSSLAGAPICSAERRGSCIAYTDGEPPNRPIDFIASVKLDYIRIYDNTVDLPLITEGTYNENAIVDNRAGLRLFPSDEWSTKIANAALGFSNNSYYQADANEVGSQFALKVNNSEPATVVIDVGQVNEKATKLLACTNSIEGAMQFNGTSYDVAAPSNCIVTNDATQQTQLVFNQNNLPNLDGSGGETTLFLQSMNDSEFIIDGYQVLYGTTLTEGYYEESIGYGTTNSILTLSSISGTDDWDLLRDENYSGSAALRTAISGTNVSFEFEGTGISLMFGQGETIANCLRLRGGVCTNYEIISNPLGKVSIVLETAAAPTGVCDGSCHDDGEIAPITEMQVVPGPYSIAGLPFDTYKVTITAYVDETLDEDVVLDAIEVYGALQQLGSLYDDSQVDVSGDLLLTYSPSGSIWSNTLPNANGDFLNNTYHYTTTGNATVSFEVGSVLDTEAIILYDGNPSLPDPVCLQSGRRIVCDPVPFAVPSSSSVEVCWSDLSSATLARECQTITNLDDGMSSRRIPVPDDLSSPGNYNVSITNKASGEPLYIDAIQVIEAGLMTEGIYEEDFFEPTYSPITNTNAVNNFVIGLDDTEQAEFTFEGIAFSVQIVESSTNFSVCAYAGDSTGDGPCGTASDVINDIITPASGTLSSVTYGGFHDIGPKDNGRWTVILTNNDATNPLLIDRVDILGNNDSLIISDKGTTEAGDPQIRYLPFGSWTETTEFKDGEPLNGSQFDTTIPGSGAYFEFNQDDVGIEYIRQIQDYMPESQVCVRERRGNCIQFEPVPPSPAFADAKMCLGEIGDPSAIKCDVTVVDFDNGDDNEVNAGLSIFEFSSSTDEPVALDCANGCWAFIEYSRDAVDSLTPLDYIRFYDPDSSLTEGVYQESHPNIGDSGDAIPIADETARVGFYDLVSGTVGEAYFYFPFQGTGFATRMLETENAEDVLFCVIDYTGEATPTLPADIPADDDCVNTFNNEAETDGFVTRSLHGLDNTAEYMAIIKINSPDGSTVMGLDQVTIFDNQWYDPAEINNTDYLNILTGGDSYPVDFKNRESEKIVQFIGNWQSISEQILVGYDNPRRMRDPIFVTEEGDRGFDSGTSILFRTDLANAAGFDIELSETGRYQACALPLVNNDDWEVDVSSGAICQMFTQSGRAIRSFVFSDTNTPHVIMIQLLDNDVWMSLYNVSALDVTSGLGAGTYDDTAPGIQYDSTYEAILDDSLEESLDDDTADDGTGWDKIGSSTSLKRAGQTEVCVEGRRGLECTYEPEETREICVEGRRGPECNYIPEPSIEVCVQGRRGLECNYEYQNAFDGNFSRKIVANIGQGIKYLGNGSGLTLENDTYYTVMAHVFINDDSVGGVEMRLISGTEVISEVEGIDLTTTTRGTWQTLRADFKTVTAHSDLSLQFIAINGQTIFFLDDVTVTTGGEWSTGTAPMLPEVCTGSRRNQTCVPGGPQFKTYNAAYSFSTTPGASFSFEFSGTGFEIGLIGGNPTGEVEVCYSNEVGFANPNCFTYIQDDGVSQISEICTRERRGVCTSTEQVAQDTLNITGRGVAGLPSDDWTVVVREIDDGYSLAAPTESRFVGISECVSERRGVCTQYATEKQFTNASFGLDFINIFGDDDIPTVPFGFFNEDAQDETESQYLGLYPESTWSSFSGNSSFTKATYAAPSDGNVPSTIPGPVALVDINVPVDDAEIAVVFQFGGDATDFANDLLLCVDETSGKMSWDGTQYILSNSDSCKIVNNAGIVGQASITSDDVASLGDQGDHTVTITALTQGRFRVDAYQIFDGRELTVGLHNESLPSTILDFGPSTLNASPDCDFTSDWCYTNTKTTIQEICTAFRGTTCRRSTLQPVTVNPYIGSAAVTSQSGATLNFVAEGTGFSIISDVDDNGLDFRVCYKLESSDTSFPTHTTPAVGEEAMALNGVDADGLPILINEGGVLCENLTTDTDNWDAIMDRPLSSGEQYGFSYYGLPFGVYEVQVMVTTPASQIDESEWFTIDAINVFSDSIELAALTSDELTDDLSDNISYEPSLFWDANVTSSTYLNTDHSSTHAGAISQFRVEGNTVVLYQTVGDMTPDARICLVISNENIHCSVEAERQTRLARQVSTFTQVGALVPGEVCVRQRRGTCIAYAIQSVQETTPFTPVVFYGLGVVTEETPAHKIIVENRVHGKTFNLDAIQVIQKID